MNPSFREILRTLNRHQVDYLVVGGVAAVVQGAPMTTFDLDALMRAIVSMGKPSDPAIEMFWPAATYC